MLTDGGPVVEAPWRAKVQAAGTLVVATAVTILGFAAIYSGFHTNAEIQAYRSAGTCAAAVDALSGDSCRYVGTGTVTGTSQQSALEVDLTVSALPGHRFAATFPFSREPVASSLTTGATAPAEVWNGEVTEFAGVKSAEEPEYSVQGLAPIGLGFVIAGAGGNGVGRFPGPQGVAPLADGFRGGQVIPNRSAAGYFQPARSVVLVHAARSVTNSIR